MLAVGSVLDVASRAKGAARVVSRVVGGEYLQLGDLFFNLNLKLCHLRNGLVLGSGLGFGLG